MFSEVKYLYIDLAGVQYNFRKGLSRLVREHGLSYEDFSENVAYIEDRANRGEVSDINLYATYARLLHLDLSPSQVLDLWTNQFTPIVPVHRMLQQLSNRVKIGIITNIHNGLFPALQKKRLLAAVSYDQVIESYKVHHAKPDREIFLLAQKKARVSPNQIVYIDDNPLFVGIAQSLGWNAIDFEEATIDESLASLTNLLM